MDYLAESARTLPDQRDFHGDLVPLKWFIAQMRASIATGNNLDMAKKAFFYGKDVFADHRKLIDGDNCQGIDLIAAGQQERAFGVDLIHGILGNYTEAVELMEALCKMLDGKPVDSTNIKEEVGDLFWYVAILARRFNFTFEDAMIANIAKLYKRYPERFTESDAIHRDTDSERVVLESFDSSTPDQPAERDIGREETEFERDLGALINRYSLENGSDTPDYALAQFMHGCLKVFNSTVVERERYYGRAARYSSGSDEPLPPAGYEGMHEVNATYL